MLLSVILPVYNGALYLHDAIQSVLNQTFDQFELIILNDGSSDNSADIIKQFSDNRIVFVDQSNLGLAKTLNKGISISKGQYIARMDADDICYKERFEKQIKFLESNQKVKLLGTAVENIDEYGNFVSYDIPYIGSNFLKSYLKNFGNPFKHPSIIMEKEAALKAGGYNELIGKYFEDYFLWSEIAKFGEIEILPNVLLKYRITPGSIMGSIKDKEFSDFMLKIINNGEFNEHDQAEMLKIKSKVNTNSQSEKDSYIKRIEMLKNSKLNLLVNLSSKIIGKNLSISLLSKVRTSNFNMKNN